MQFQRSVVLSQRKFPGRVVNGGAAPAVPRGCARACRGGVWAGCKREAPLKLPTRAATKEGKAERRQAKKIHVSPRVGVV